MEMLDFLSAKAKNSEKLKARIWQIWKLSRVRIGVDMFDHYKDETNVLVVIGDKGYNTEFADSALVNRMVKNNCRLLGLSDCTGASLIILTILYFSAWKYD